MLQACHRFEVSWVNTSRCSTVVMHNEALWNLCFGFIQHSMGKKSCTHEGYRAISTTIDWPSP